MKTEINWISTDDRLPGPRERSIALLPRMGLFGGNNSLEIGQCEVGKDGFELIDMENECLGWDADVAMWWAPLPDWMESPGWRDKE